MSTTKAAGWPGGITQLFWRWDWSAFFERPPHGLVAHLLAHAEGDELVGEQPEAPAGLAFEGLRTGERDVVDLGRAIVLERAPRCRTAWAKGLIEALATALLQEPGDGA